MTSDLAAIIRVLSGAGVEYVIVGGVADVRALAPHAPYLRGAPAGLPFTLDEDTIARGLNFTLTTTIGDLDLLGEVTGGGAYDRVKARAQAMTLEGHDCWVVNLPSLIQLKRAAGRGRDREAIAELEALLEERERGPGKT
jgi:predicted nucleotidyltransferase